jgi:AcrR family transcriptional regulator
MNGKAVPAVRLSPGPGWLPHGQVLEIQRARILAAAADAVAESGYGALTVAAVTQRARISRKTFYEVFANRDDCFAAIVEEISARAYSLVSAACAAESSWLAATRSALSSLLRLIDEEPRLARIWFVDAMAGSDAVHEHRAEATARLAAAIELGRGLVSDKGQPSHLAGEAAVGGILQIIHARLLDGRREPFVELLGPCMYLIVLPYLGAARATAELRRRPSARAAGRRALEARRPRESLRDMNLRITYRTIRVLDAICERPGMSNRTIAEECGVKDQGQISKLLSRLERLALVENRGLGHDRGASNAWHMTPRGLELVRATNVREFMRPPQRIAARGQ